MEAFHITAGNWLKAIEFVTERMWLINQYGRNMGSIYSLTSLGKFPTDGYFVLDSGTMDYLTVEEFNEMYKPLA